MIFLPMNFVSSGVFTYRLKLYGQFLCETFSYFAAKISISFLTFNTEHHIPNVKNLAATTTIYVYKWFSIPSLSHFFPLTTNNWIRRLDFINESIWLRDLEMHLASHMIWAACIFPTIARYLSKNTCLSFVFLSQHAF